MNEVSTRLPHELRGSGGWITSDLYLASHLTAAILSEQPDAGLQHCTQNRCLPGSSSATHVTPVLGPLCISEAGPRFELNCIQTFRKNQEPRAVFQPWRNDTQPSRFGERGVKFRIHSCKLYLCDSAKHILIYDFKMFCLVCLAQIAKYSLVSQGRLQTAWAR